MRRKNEAVRETAHDLGADPALGVPSKSEDQRPDLAPDHALDLDPDHEVALAEIAALEANPLCRPVSVMWETATNLPQANVLVCSA